MTPPKDPSKYEAYCKRMSEIAMGNKNCVGRVLSEESKKKMSESAKERCTPEWKEKQSNKMKGKTLTDEHKQKISLGGRGRKLSQETREKMAKYHTGKKLPLEVREKLSEIRTGKYIGEKNPFFGKHHSEETIEKMRNRQISDETKKKISISHKGKPMSEETKRKISLAQQGENCYLWKGGISFEPYCPKFNREFKERVRAFFNYQCVECNTPQNGEKLHVHHVNFNKESCCDNSIPLFVPLCRSCHMKTNTNRKYWEQHFTDIINQYYGGRCYLMKEEHMPIMAIVGGD